MRFDPIYEKQPFFYTYNLQLTAYRYFNKCAIESLLKKRVIEKNHHVLCFHCYDLQRINSKVTMAIAKKATHTCTGTQWENRNAVSWLAKGLTDVWQPVWCWLAKGLTDVCQAEEEMIHTFRLFS